jgi:hypothetical protein
MLIPKSFCLDCVVDFVTLTTGSALFESIIMICVCKEESLQLQHFKSYLLLVAPMENFLNFLKQLHFIGLEWCDEFQTLLIKVVKWKNLQKSVNY